MNMRKSFVLLFLFSYLASNSQSQYYDALKLRISIRWIYIWNITSIDVGVPPTLKEESPIPYPTGFVRNDAIISGKHIHFVSQQGSSKIGFSSETAPKELVKAILRYYSSDPSQTDFSIIAKEYGSNDFINPYIITNPGIAAAGSFASALSSSTFNSIGGLNITNFADGLAKFLVKRFKDELTLAFFDKFKDDLKNSTELITLFPETNKTLQTIDKDIYQFSLYLNTLRQAFIKDLGNLYANFKKAEQLPSFQAYFAVPGHLAIKTIVSNAFFFIDQYVNGIHPGDVIANYDPDATLFFSDGNIQTNIRSSIKVLKIFSSSLRSSSASNYWVPADSVKALLVDPITTDLYFGLVYQKGDGISFHTQTGDQTFRNLLKTAKGIANQINEYKQHIENIIDHAQEVNEYLTSLKGKKKSDIDYNDYHNLFNSSLDVLEEGLSFVDLAAVNIEPNLKLNIKADADQWINMARSAGELYVDIRTKNYSSAVINTITLVDDIFGASANNQLKADILKYGSFAAAIAQSQNSDDVEKAIESIALPVGSYSIKQHSCFNISVNGYVGYAFDFNGGMSSGIYAPVGLSFNWGLGKNKNWGAFTFFASILDVGGIVSYRLRDDNTANLKQDIRLESILSPSAQLIYGIPNWPVAICAGWRLTPKLIYSSSTDFQVVQPKNVLNLSVLIDIPLVILINKTKK
jgi:hypothetical protein